MQSLGVKAQNYHKSLIWCKIANRIPSNLNPCSVGVMDSWIIGPIPPDPNVGRDYDVDYALNFTWKVKADNGDD